MMHLQAIIARNAAGVNNPPDDAPPLFASGVLNYALSRGPGAPSDPLPFAMAHPHCVGTHTDRLVTEPRPYIGAAFANQRKPVKTNAALIAAAREAEALGDDA